MTNGAFPPGHRAAILNATGGTCAGCGTTRDLTTQHRLSRGMGGTHTPTTGHASNGVPLCGSGTTGCHGWTEAHPTHARALGWRIDTGEDPATIPWWTRDGWRQWTLDGDPSDATSWLVAYADTPPRVLTTPTGITYPQARS